MRERSGFLTRRSDGRHRRSRAIARTAAAGPALPRQVPRSGLDEIAQRSFPCERSKGGSPLYRGAGAAATATPCGVARDRGAVTERSEGNPGASRPTSAARRS